MNHVKEHEYWKKRCKKLEKVFLNGLSNKWLKANGIKPGGKTAQSLERLNSLLFLKHCCRYLGNATGENVKKGSIPKPIVVASIGSGATVGTLPGFKGIEAVKKLISRLITVLSEAGWGEIAIVVVMAAMLAKIRNIQICKLVRGQFDWNREDNTHACVYKCGRDYKYTRIPANEGCLTYIVLPV